MRVDADQSWRRLWPWLILALALAVRGVFLVRDHARLVEDPDAYQEIARNLVTGHGFALGNPPQPTAYRPPLFPLLLAGLFQLGGGPTALGIIQATLGFLTVWLTIRIGQRLDLGMAALLAGLIVAVDPILAQYTARAMTETLCTFLAALWLWAVMAPPEIIRRRPSVWAIVAGAAFGLCLLCRPTFLGVGLLLLARFAWQQAHRPRQDSERISWRWAGTAAATCLLVLLPWTIRNGLVIGRFTPLTTHGGYTLLLANNRVFYAEVLNRSWGTVWQEKSLLRWQAELEQRMAAAEPPILSEPDRDRWLSAEARREILADPTSFARACLWRFARFWDILPQAGGGGLPRPVRWGIGLFYSVVLISGLVGLVQLIRQGEAHPWFPLLALIAGFSLIHLFFWTDLRMRAPAVPALALLSALPWSRGREIPVRSGVETD